MSKANQQQRSLFKSCFNQTDAFPDISILVGPGPNPVKYLAHRMILNRCEFYHALLNPSSSFKESTESEIYHPDMDPAIFEMLMEYLYDDVLTVEKGNIDGTQTMMLLKLLEVGDRMLMDGAFLSLCKNNIKVTDTNVCDIWSMVIKYHDPMNSKLYQECLDTFCTIFAHPTDGNKVKMIRDRVSKMSIDEFEAVVYHKDLWVDINNIIAWAMEWCSEQEECGIKVFNQIKKTLYSRKAPPLTVSGETTTSYLLHATELDLVRQALTQRYRKDYGENVEWRLRSAGYSGGGGVDDDLGQFVRQFFAKEKSPLLIIIKTSDDQLFSVFCDRYPHGDNIKISRKSFVLKLYPPAVNSDDQSCHLSCISIVQSNEENSVVCSYILQTDPATKLCRDNMMICNVLSINDNESTLSVRVVGELEQTFDIHRIEVFRVEHRLLQ